jgi:hypothetical protein|tara:strand:+ start:105 stop:617 length:513 start_codon:yes stop_codon:yes gene_type:complete
MEQHYKGDYSMPQENPIFITGECNWAFLIEPNSKFSDDRNPPIWSIDVDVNDENRPVIEGAGLTIKTKEGRNDFVTFKRKTIWPNGEPKEAPIVIDAECNSWDGKRIANGSVISVKAIPYTWNFNGKSGRGADLSKVQVLEFIEYVDSAEDFTPVEGGYVQETASQSDPF